jgi:DNA modification methylase
MGVGMPEYVLLFRKPPTQMDNAYADEPVEKSKEEYDISTWQLDAHAYYRSDGNRFLSFDELQKFDFDKICKAWRKHNEKDIYSYEEHLKICQDLEELGKLSKLFTTLPVHSNNDLVWTDINRMNTLNAKQVNSKKEKHICPLQIDIIKRLINRFTMKGEIVDDPFGGLFSTAYEAMEMERKSVSVELNSEYYRDGLSYIHAMHHKMNIPTLFDLVA